MCRPGRFLRRVVAMSLLWAFVGDARASDADPVLELRARQQRLSHLEHAIREAELVQRLCDLDPANPECAEPAPAFDHGAGGGGAEARVRYALIEVFGSDGRLQAVLVGPDGARRTVRVGEETPEGARVDRIGPDSVQLLTPAGVSVLRVGPE